MHKTFVVVQGESPRAPDAPVVRVRISRLIDRQFQLCSQIGTENFFAPSRAQTA